MSLEDSKVSLPELLLKFDPKTLKQLKRNIIVVLGAGRVKVELSEEQLNYCVEESVETLTPYFAHRNSSYYILQAIPGQGEYDLPQGTRIIQDVIYDPTNSVLVPNKILTDGVYMLDQATDTATYFMMLSAIKTAQKVYSKISAWEFIDGNKIRIFPTPDKSHTIVLKLVGSFSSIGRDQYNWIKKYAIAEAMTILGRIRSKFSQIPSSQGQVSFDGNEMKQEGDQAKATILQEVMLRNPVWAFTTG